MRSTRLLALVFLATASPLLAQEKVPLPREAPSGIYRAEAIAASPVLSASGMVWWGDRLIIADRVGKRLLAFRLPDQFETFKELERPVGLAVDPNGDLIVGEKEPENRILRVKKDGSIEVLASDVLSPHFLTVHRNGTIFFSGFPDGGTRSLPPGGKPVVHAPRIVHTYGVGLSPRQDYLYVASKIPNPDRRGVWRFPLTPESKVGEGEFFLKVQELQPKIDGLAEAKDGSASLLGWVGRLQGLAVDVQGNLYIAGAESHTSGEAIAVVTPDGKSVRAMILGVPRNISGLAFGGAHGRTLFITGAGEYRLHQVELPVAGLGR
jgi:gluconolactonase